MKHPALSLSLFLITGILALACLPSSATAQNNDSITVIQYQKQGSKPADTTDYRSPVKNKIPTQRPDNFWRRMTVGGWLGFQFGSITSIAVSPEVKIRLFDQVYLGLGATYEYNRFNDYLCDLRDGSWVDFTSNTYGGRIFLRYYLGNFFDNFLANVFFHSEYEYLYYTMPYTQSSNGYLMDNYGYTYRDGKQDIEINSIFVGGGYRQPVSGRMYMDFLLLFNLNDTQYSPYNNPIFRIGFGVGL